MKTPDEIKKGLECVGGLIEPCVSGCPYEKSCECGLTAARDAIEYIQQLEYRLAQVEMERDALIRHVQGKCHACKYIEGYPNKRACSGCKHTYYARPGSIDNWEWRGVCEQNTKDG